MCFTRKKSGKTCFSIKNKTQTEKSKKNVKKHKKVNLASLVVRNGQKIEKNLKNQKKNM